MKMRERYENTLLLLLLGLSQFCWLSLSATGVDECCRAHHVPDVCVRKMCYPLNPPGDFDVYEIFDRKNNCTRHLPEIAQCLANGRHHLHCCTTEAKDNEESACFGLCEGVGKIGKSWNAYQSCLAINLPSIFVCFQKGYVSIPSPPLNPRLENIEVSSVTVTWDVPEQNDDQVTSYRVVVTEQTDSRQSSSSPSSQLTSPLSSPLTLLSSSSPPSSSLRLFKLAETNEDIVATTNEPRRHIETKVVGVTHVRIVNLQPGTLYNAYVIAVGNTPTQHSLSSDLLDFQTVGVAPQIHAYKEIVHVPKNAKSALLACRLHMSSVSQSSAQLEWQHRAIGAAEFTTVKNGGRYNLSNYVSANERPREYVMTLQIRNVRDVDFGLYRCTVNDKYGHASVEIQLIATSVPIASPQPPHTPLECCRLRGVEKRCLSMCGASEGSDVKRYIPRPFMPINCSSEISKVLSCAMPGVDDGECCLREHVPRACMYLCDSSVAPSNHMDSLCLEHMTAVEHCRVRGVEQRPATVEGLRVHTSSGTDAVVLQWNVSHNAEIYHVYWRKTHDSSWQQKSVVRSSKKIVGGAEEVVLVAANVYGISQPSRLNIGSSKWSRR